MQWKDVKININLEGNVWCEEISQEEMHIHAQWTSCEVQPMLTMEWSVPIVDIGYEWYPNCGCNRWLHVDWNGAEKSGIAFSAPVYCFFNAAGQNRFTMALSDVKTLLYNKLGVHEEDGTLLCKVEIPLDASKGTHTYDVILYRSGEDVSFAEALRSVSKWWEETCGYKALNVPQEALTPMYSTWYSYHQGVDALKIEEECKQAVKMGMKTVIVDDGWQTEDDNRGYAYCGDWNVAKSKIPDMRSFVSNVHGIGMKVMLWYSVPFMGYQSENFERFKDKLVYSIDSLRAGVLDPRYKEVREYLIDTYEQALEMWDLDGFKLDFIDSFRPYKENIPLKTEDMDYTLVEDGIDCLMTELHKRLRKIKPNILIEFRQSYIGPKMREYGNMLRVGDCPNDPLRNRVGVIDLRMTSGHTAVHSDPIMWHKDDTIEAVALQLQSALFSVPQVSVKLKEMSQEQKETVSFWLNFITAHQDLLQNAPLEVEGPQNLYPVVRAEKDASVIFALYDGNHMVKLHKHHKDVYLVNATQNTNVGILTDELRLFKVKIMDCKGEIIEENEMSIEKIGLLQVPPSGLVQLCAVPCE